MNNSFVGIERDPTCFAVAKVGSTDSIPPHGYSMGTQYRVHLDADGRSRREPAWRTLRKDGSPDVEHALTHDRHVTATSWISHEHAMSFAVSLAEPV